MTKRKYKNKCRKLFDKAKALGVELDFSPKQFDPKKLNCLWHGGWYAYIKLSEDLDVEIGVIGDPGGLDSGTNCYLIHHNPSFWNEFSF